MVKELAKLSFENPKALSKRDVDLIQRNLRERVYFDSCLEILEEMSRTKFYESHTVYDVMKMSENAMARFTKNEKFTANMKASLDRISHYGDDLKSLLKEAVKANRDFKTGYGALDSIFCRHLPKLVIEKLAFYLTPADLPAE